LEKAAQAQEVGTRVRAFFGLPLPEAQRATLAEFVSRCAESAPGFRWTPGSNLHLTIRFIGQAELAVVEGIADRLTAASLPAFDVELGELGTFRRGRLVRVVWQGLASGSEAVTALARQVDAECAAAGFASEKRLFQAHLTLARARAREGAPLPALPPPPRPGLWRAKELVLYQSRLGRAGAVYEPLRVLELD
jgi:2'-5' RNA ligase